MQQLAEIMVKLHGITESVQELFHKYLDRGLTVEDLEAKSQDLSESSQVFIVKILPWYRRCRCRCWWWFRLNA